MKPHEETWRGVGGYVEDVESGRLRAKVGDNNPERVALIASAPKMARRLLARVLHCDVCKGTGKTSVRGAFGRDLADCTYCDEDRSVLSDAGVLP